ncbi:hypothetical protein E2I00_014994 [Balaenoptera physalus]|uniref:Uncharacterized protein n=1 Tax=Balaenoptera physalus TaxID=9770 RepID=A0A6A1Q6G5_BALPH|nr:hypothetical protein E2I00_014994 [Balaenoptera physalus]
MRISGRRRGLLSPQMLGNWTFGTLVFTVMVFTVTLKAVPQLSKDVLCVHTNAVQRPRLAGHRPARRRQPPSRRPQESAVPAAVAQRHRESPGTAPGAVGAVLRKGSGKGPPPPGPGAPSQVVAPQSGQAPVQLWWEHPGLCGLSPAPCDASPGGQDCCAKGCDERAEGPTHRKPGYNPPGYSFRQTLSRVVEAPSSYKRPSEQEEGGSLTRQGDRICGARRQEDFCA